MCKGNSGVARRTGCDMAPSIIGKSVNRQRTTRYDQRQKSDQCCCLRRRVLLYICASSSARLIMLAAKVACVHALQCSQPTVAFAHTLPLFLKNLTVAHMRKCSSTCPPMLCPKLSFSLS